MTRTARPMIALTVAVPMPTYDGLFRLAKEAGMRREIYAANLLCAAFAARVQPTGDDPALAAAVARLDQAAAPDAHLQAALAHAQAEAHALRQALEEQRKKLRATEQELSEEVALRVGAIERMKQAERARDEALAARAPAPPPAPKPAPKSARQGLPARLAKLARMYEWQGKKPGEIARLIECDEQEVRRALRYNGGLR